MSEHIDGYIKNNPKNLLDLSDERSQLFIASCLAVLCESYPIRISLKDVQKYWNGEIRRLQYDMIPDINSGSITFSL